VKYLFVYFSITNIWNIIWKTIIYLIKNGKYYKLVTDQRRRQCIVSLKFIREIFSPWARKRIFWETKDDLNLRRRTELGRRARDFIKD